MVSRTSIVLIKSITAKPWRNPETYQMIEDSLCEFGSVQVITPDSEEELIFRLKQLKQQMKEILVFNIAEFIDEVNQTGFIPQILDQLGIPHLGSAASAITTALNKAKTKSRLQENGIPTPDFFVHHPGDPILFQQADQIGFPLFVKPLSAGGHLGVSENSIVQTPDELMERIDWLLEEFQQPVLVEAFIDDEEMREFSVGVVGNAPYLLTPIEIDFDNMPVEERILSFDAAQKDLEKVKPVPEEGLRKELGDLALRTFEAVDAKDYSRIDLRMDQDACYVLEINTMPGLGPNSFLPEAMAAQHGMEYSALIQKLVEIALQR